MSAQPHAKRKLTQQQQRVLADIEQHRFVTATMLASRLGVSPVTMRRGLPVLMRSGYIDRHYNASYRLAGKPAAYFLTTVGLRRLQPEPSKQSLRTVYGNRTAAPSLIERCLAMQQLQLSLMCSDGDRLQYFTRNQLRSYDYFPRPLPDGFVVLSMHSGMFRWFVEYVPTGQPTYALQRRLQAYMAYAESGEWDDTGEVLPELLLLCADSQTARRMRGIIRRLQDAIEDSGMRLSVVDVCTTEKILWPSIVRQLH